MNKVMRNQIRGEVFRAILDDSGFTKSIAVSSEEALLILLEILEELRRTVTISRKTQN